jgi:hypothetical protein
MKKVFTPAPSKLILSLFLAFFVISLNPANAQLSGPYTIGGTNPSFTTFTDAVNNLNAQGVSGPVVFNVRDGLYSEQVTITQFSGSSATNTVIFQSVAGDSTKVTLSFPSSSAATNNFVVYMNGADYITFKNMTFERTGSFVNARIFDFFNGANNNTITNCQFYGVIATSANTTNSLIFSNTGTNSNDNDNTIRNCLFLNGSYGLSISGVSATSREGTTTIENNIFTNQYGRGIHMANQDGVVLNNNMINTTANNATFYGMFCQDCDKGSLITNNQIDAFMGGYGLYLSACTGVNGNEALIANNFIHVGGLGTAYGIFVTGCDFQGIYHNNINVTSTSATNGRAIQIASTSKIDCRNNNFVNTGGGYSLYSSSTTALTTSDNNNFFSTGASFNYWGTTPVSNLSSWRSTTGKDISSVSVNPEYMSYKDLHVKSVSLFGAGTPIPVVTKDIDGQLRSTTTPDIGADEFFPLTFNMGPVGIINPVGGTCGAANTTVRGTIKNFGAISQSNIPVTVEVSGPGVNTTFNTVHVGPMAANKIDTVIFTGSFSTLPGGTYSFKIYTSLSGDQDMTNDTMTVSIAVSSTPSSPTGVAGSNCGPGVVLLSATGGPQDSLVWYGVSVGGNPLKNGSTYTTPFLVNTTTYYVEAKIGTCKSLRTPVIASILSFPTVNLGNDTTILQGNNVTLNAGNPGATNYAWTIDGNAIGGNTQTLTASAAGNYCVTVTAANGCSKNACMNLFVVSSVNEIPGISGLSLYPNPVSGQLNLKLVSQNNTELEVSLLNNLMQIVKNEKFAVSGIYQGSMELSGLQPGVYFVQLSTTQAKSLHRIVIQ